jgi:hypothetical protein
MEFKSVTQTFLLFIELLQQILNNFIMFAFILLFPV